MSSASSDQYELITYRNMSAGTNTEFGETSSNVYCDSLLRSDDVDEIYERF